MIRLALAAVCVAIVVITAAGCATPPKAYLPVDNQLRPFQAPEVAEDEPAAPAPAKKPVK
jgi:hypothetical protein